MASLFPDDSEASLTRSHEISDLYDRWAPRYDRDVNPTRDLSRKAIAALLPDLRGKRILEAGCGTGELLAAFSTTADAVIGFDISLEMLRTARRRLRGSGVLLVRCDLTLSWPAANEALDVVVISLVLEHIARLEPVFAEAYRVLRPGGWLAVVELHPQRQRRGVRAQFQEPDSGCRVELPAVVHSVQEFLQAARAAGFSVLQQADWFDAAHEKEPRLFSLLARCQ